MSRDSQLKWNDQNKREQERKKQMLFVNQYTALPDKVANLHIVRFVWRYNRSLYKNLWTRREMKKGEAAKTKKKKTECGKLLTIHKILKYLEYESVWLICNLPPIKFECNFDIVYYLLISLATVFFWGRGRGALIERLNNLQCELDSKEYKIKLSNWPINWLARFIRHNPICNIKWDSSTNPCDPVRDSHSHSNSCNQIQIKHMISLTLFGIWINTKRFGCCFFFFLDWREWAYYYYCVYNIILFRYTFYYYYSSTNKSYRIETKVKRIINDYYCCLHTPYFHSSSYFHTLELLCNIA